MNIQTSYFSKISNFLFLVVVIFSLLFIWINYYLKSLNKSLMCSLIILLTFLIIYTPIKLRAKNTKIKKAVDKKNKEAIKTYLLYGKNSQILQLFLKLLNLQDSTIIKDNHILLNHKKDIFLLFNKESIDNEDISKCYKSAVSNEIEIYCIGYTKPYIELDNTHLRILNFDEIAKIINNNSINFLFDINIKKSPKYSLKQILCILLSKEKSRNYLWLSILITFSSLFTPYNIYYIIISTILLLLSIYSRFNKKYN